MLALSTLRHGIIAAAEYLPIWMRSRERLQRRNALLTYLIGGPKMKFLYQRGWDGVGGEGSTCPPHLGQPT